MSLTSMLKDRDSWLSVFLSHRFGHLAQFVAVEVRGKVTSLNTKVLLRQENRPMPWTVGKSG